ncbi:hypothetical protein ABT332_13340 [Saccharomonospora azurea]|uniref:hypothetical protein n=1 Tax=Saccharomonospora azurea TaxID=40988 RepID=UPI0033318C18
MPLPHRHPSPQPVDPSGKPRLTLITNETAEETTTEIAAVQPTETTAPAQDTAPAETATPQSSATAETATPQSSATEETATPQSSATEESTKLPNLLTRFWYERPASLAERWEYSRRGDWAATPSPTQRNLHLALTVALTFIPAVIAAVLERIDTPARLAVAVALFVIAYHLI